MFWDLPIDNERFYLSFLISLKPPKYLFVSYLLDVCLTKNLHSIDTTGYLVAMPNFSLFLVALNPHIIFLNSERINCKSMKPSCSQLYAKKMLTAIECTVFFFVFFVFVLLCYLNKINYCYTIIITTTIRGYTIGIGIKIRFMN